MWLFLRLQAGISLVFPLVVFAAKGLIPSLSVLAGGVVALSGSVVYVAILRKNCGPKALQILHLHFAAELAKLLAMSAAVVVVFLWFRQVEWFWLVAGCLAAYSAYWFGLLTKN